jgi:hypothetical protein
MGRRDRKFNPGRFCGKVGRQLGDSYLVVFTEWNSELPAELSIQVGLSALIEARERLRRDQRFQPGRVFAVERSYEAVGEFLLGGRRRFGRFALGM